MCGALYLYFLNKEDIQILFAIKYLYRYRYRFFNGKIKSREREGQKETQVSVSQSPSKSNVFRLYDLPKPRKCLGLGIRDFKLNKPMANIAWIQGSASFIIEAASTVLSPS